MCWCRSCSECHSYRAVKEKKHNLQLISVITSTILHWTPGFYRSLFLFRQKMSGCPLIFKTLLSLLLLTLFFSSVLSWKTCVLKVQIWSTWIQMIHVRQRSCRWKTGAGCDRQLMDSSAPLAPKFSPCLWILTHISWCDTEDAPHNSRSRWRIFTFLAFLEFKSKPVIVLRTSMGALQTGSADS